MQDLPLIMAAVNGASRTGADHPMLPVTVEETARAAAACHEAGAGAVHLHVRDRDGRHVLDAGLYRQATEAVHAATGGRMLVQITTEAVGRYSPQEQRQVVRAVVPRAVSVALREMVPDAGEEKEAAAFYGWAHGEDIAVQHILYAPEEVLRFADLAARGVVTGERFQLLFVLGRYAKGQESDPASLFPFLTALGETGLEQRCDWAVCAVGVSETRSLATALALGGRIRVGFENSLWNADGSVAADNAERVARMAAIAGALGRQI